MIENNKNSKKSELSLSENSSTVAANVRPSVMDFVNQQYDKQQALMERLEDL